MLKGECPDNSTPNREGSVQNDSRDRGATLRLGGGGGGAPLVTQYWGDTRHFFLLNLYNFQNMPPPLLRGPWIRQTNQRKKVGLLLKETSKCESYYVRNLKTARCLASRRTHQISVYVEDNSIKKPLKPLNDQACMPNISGWGGVL